MNRLLRNLAEILLGISLGTFVAGVVVVFVLIISVPVMVLNAWVLCSLWEWFIVPVFDVRSINLAESMGIILICNHLKRMPHPRKKTKKQEEKTKEEKEEDRHQFIQGLAYCILGPLVGLWIGYIVHLFV